MARLSDLPPEIRLKIYKLLLVDSIQKGPRISFDFDPLKGITIERSRSHCTKTEEDHSTHCCRPYDAFHHLDFTDLMSLAVTNRTIYKEASQIIYNNADLTLSNYHWLMAAKMAPALRLLRRYLEKHCLPTREMLLTLAIRDQSATMSPGDARSIVDLINTHLPNLRIFEYHVIEDDSGSPLTLTRYFSHNYARAIKTVQPFVAFKAGIRTTLDMPVPTEAKSRYPQVHSLLCRLRKRFVEEALQDIVYLREIRRVVHDCHAWAVGFGCYLQATQALRADADEDVLPEIPVLDEVLTSIRSLGITSSSCRDSLRAARERS